MKERDHSIDIAKGLLVLSVVWFHMKTILSGSCGLEHPMYVTLYLAHKGYAIFFMPAFFLITGYCSNFNKPFKEFLLSNVKGVLIPMLILNVIPCMLTFSIEGMRYLVTWSNWLYGLSFWFLPVLFVAKLMYWPINHFIEKKHVSLVIAICCFICAILLTKVNHLPNFWYWKSALAYVFFLWFGHFFKHEIDEKKRIKWMQFALVIYAIILSIVLIFKLPVWYLGLSLSCSIIQMPFYLIAAIAGSLSVLYISHLISRNTVLEYIGHASLVVYCTHWFIGQHLGKYLSQVFIPDSNVNAILFYIIVFGTTVLCSCVFYYFYQAIMARLFGFNQVYKLRL